MPETRHVHAGPVTFTTTGHIRPTMRERRQRTPAHMFAALVGHQEINENYGLWRTEPDCGRQ